MKKKVSIIIPVYNEVSNLSLMLHAIKEVMTPLSYDYHIIFVDDGSDDETLSFIRKLAGINPEVNFISFSRNFGHQNALKAGFDMSYADAVISMDGDMQHPPAVLPSLLALWEEGNDIVYTIRKDHREMPRMKRKTSDIFYNILNRLSSIELEKGTADFRLLDKKVVDVLREIKEYDLFWRGLVKWLGFKQVSIEYDPAERATGKSKYTYRKMMEFALRGITSFSTKPLTIAIYLGFISAALSILYIPYALVSYFSGHAISGWASVIVTVAFFGGIQLMILGIIGMYLGKLFMQSKQRPHYIINESKAYMKGYTMLSFDVEEFDIPLEYNQIIDMNEQMETGRRGLDALIPLWDKYKIPCTLFTTANYAMRFPASIKALAREHEIASHTFYHSSFEDEHLLQSKKVLEDISGSGVTGLRMPRMRKVDMKEVEKAGYLYDSSVNPTYIPGRYNNFNLPRTVYKEENMIRIPASVSPVMRMPLFWLGFKNYPYRLFRSLCLQTLKRDGYVCLYFHPWEFTDISNYKLPGYVKKPDGKLLLSRLEKLINDLAPKTEFITMHDFLSGKNYFHNQD